MGVKFHKYEPEEFVRCEHCKAALQFDEKRSAWICKPVCDKPTIIEAQLQEVHWKERKNHEVS